MKSIIIGGNYGKESKSSSIVQKLGEELKGEIHNGGTYNYLKEIALTLNKYDLVIWMPNIDNSYDDINIYKKTGSVLIVSKAIRDNTRSRGDAVERIFKYHGNGVIAIEYGKKFKFTVIDALNNDWASTKKIENVAKGIKKLYKWTKKAKREGTLRKKDELDRFISINKSVSDTIIQIQGRFFGNLSTRCASLFPSRREDNGFLVSGRNTDKRSLQRTDMVECFIQKDKIRYFGERKPSVDTPVQVSIYENLPNINFMIHGHNVLEGAPTTKNYYPCGDKREIPEIIELIDGLSAGAINLKNHGFLLFSETLDDLEDIAKNIKIKEL